MVQRETTGNYFVNSILVLANYEFLTGFLNKRPVLSQLVIHADMLLWIFASIIVIAYVVWDALINHTRNFGTYSTYMIV